VHLYAWVLGIRFNAEGFAKRLRTCKRVSLLAAAGAEEGLGGIRELPSWL